MAGYIKIEASVRNTKGKGAAGRMRRSGRIPAIVYGTEAAERLIDLDEHTFVQMMRHHLSEHLVSDLVIDGQAPIKVLVREIQHHPVTSGVLHVDFQEISMQKKLCVSVPVELKGEPEGVTQQGGSLEHLIRSIEIECLPADIPEAIDVDVSALKIGGRILVSQIALDPAKYKLITAGDIAVAAVLAPRVVAEPTAEEAAAAEGAAAATPEGEAKKEEKKDEGAAKKEASKK